MVNKRILIISGQEIFNEKTDGGKQGNIKNYRLLQQVFGKENVYLCIISNNKNNDDANIIKIPTHKSTIAKIINIMNGNLFTGSKVEDEIVKYIKK